MKIFLIRVSIIKNQGHSKPGRKFFFRPFMNLGLKKKNTSTTLEVIKK